MVDQTQQLVRCFVAMFPSLSPDQVPEASVENVAEWDSLATMRLVALLEQEFGAQIDIFDLPELSSFVAVRDYLSKTQPAFPKDRK
jgi:acyl carrier protein